LTLETIDVSEKKQKKEEEEESKEKEEETEEKKVNVIPLGEDTIIYEVPKLDENQAVDPDIKGTIKTVFPKLFIIIASKKLTIRDRLMIQSVINILKKSSPVDEISRETIQAYLNQIIDNSLNWLVFSNTLLLRSLNQFVSSQTRDRSVL